MQLLSWAMDRGSLVLPLTSGQFLAVYALPITPAEGGLPPPAAACCRRCLLPPLPAAASCRIICFLVQPAATCRAHPLTHANCIAHHYFVAAPEAEQEGEEAEDSQAKRRRKGRVTEARSGGCHNCRLLLFSLVTLVCLPARQEEPSICQTEHTSAT